MTVEYCLETCLALGAPGRNWAALHENTCACGATNLFRQNYLEARPSTALTGCKTQCRGNLNELCGGPTGERNYFWSTYEYVYNTTANSTNSIVSSSASSSSSLSSTLAPVPSSSVPSSSINTVATRTTSQRFISTFTNNPLSLYGYEFVECYGDNYKTFPDGLDRPLDSSTDLAPPTMNFTFGGQNSVDLCLATCIALGPPYWNFAIVQKRDCACGSALLFRETYRTQRPVNSTSYCNFGCPGNANMYCGGPRGAAGNAFWSTYQYLPNGTSSITTSSASVVSSSIPQSPPVSESSDPIAGSVASSSAINSAASGSTAGSIASSRIASSEATILLTSSLSTSQTASSIASNSITSSVASTRTASVIASGSTMNSVAGGSITSFVASISVASTATARVIPTGSTMSSLAGGPVTSSEASISVASSRSTSSMINVSTTSFQGRNSITTSIASNLPTNVVASSSTRSSLAILQTASTMASTPSATTSSLTTSSLASSLATVTLSSTLRASSSAGTLSISSVASSLATSFITRAASSIGATPTPGRPASFLGYTYTGCYADNSFLLNITPAMPSMDVADYLPTESLAQNANPGNTVEVCIASCNAKSRAVAIIHVSQCYCGSKNLMAAALFQCMSLCPGTPNQYCGGQPSGLVYNWDVYSLT
ncbi:hypothetical protein PVAG01_06223 [Phlyctema vagabunda]|uniref:WSC domain-containing protein n=1 Tax=Phlyctema vagabunda TaxID=108571 RepID=A0ABR4PFF5_9HELO